MKDEGKKTHQSNSEFIIGNIGIRSGDSGFIDTLRCGSVHHLDAGGHKDFAGIQLKELIPADPSERFPVAGQIQTGRVDQGSCSTENDRIIIKSNAYTDHLKATFEFICACNGDNQLSIDLRMQLVGTGWLASLGVLLPLVMQQDPLKQRTTVGGEARNEFWRLDQNDEDTSEEWQRRVSDKKARWPLWRVGGLLVDAPHHYLIWKSSDHTTPPLPMDQGRESPGWIMYSDEERRIRITWTDIHSHYPSGLTIDSTQRHLGIWLHPAAIRPIKISGPLDQSIHLIIDI